MTKHEVLWPGSLIPALLKRTRHGLASLTDPMSGHGKAEIEPLML